MPCCSWEKEHISSEALEAARIAANKYMVKVRSMMERGGSQWPAATIFLLRAGERVYFALAVSLMVALKRWLAPTLACF